MTTPGEHPALAAAFAVVALALCWMSLRWHAKILRGLHAGGGRFSDAAFGVADGVAGGLLALWLLANALPALGLGSGADTAPEMQVDADVVLASMTYFGGIVALLLGLLAIRGKSPVRVLGLDAVGASRAVTSGLLALLAIYPLLGMAAAAGSLIPGNYPKAQGVVEFFLSSETLGDRLLVIVLAVVVAPVCEEIVFRGYLYGAAKKFLGSVGAALATAVLFALVHAHVPGLGVFFMLSLGLTLAVERSGSLLPAMAMHALFNFVSLALMLLFPEALPV